jgi:hypothetical protein
MTLRPLIQYLLYISFFIIVSKKLQNFQPGGFQFYDAMSFIIPSTAHGHSSFRGSRSNDANPRSESASAMDDREDVPGAPFISFFMIIAIST